jgi:hypothetical protein
LYVKKEVPLQVQRRDGYYTRNDEYFTNIQANGIKVADAVVTRNIEIGDEFHKTGNFLINGREINDTQWAAVETIQPINPDDAPKFAGVVLGAGVSGATGPYPNPVLSLSPEVGIVVFSTGATATSDGTNITGTALYTVDPSSGTVTIVSGARSSTLSSNNLVVASGALTATLLPSSLSLISGSTSSVLSTTGLLFTNGGGATNSSSPTSIILSSGGNTLTAQSNVLDVRTNNNAFISHIANGGMYVLNNTNYRMQYDNDATYGASLTLDDNTVVNGTKISHSSLNVGNRFVFDNTGPSSSYRFVVYDTAPLTGAFFQTLTKNDGTIRKMELLRPVADGGTPFLSADIIANEFALFSPTNNKVLQIIPSATPTFAFNEGNGDPVLRTANIGGINADVSVFRNAAFANPNVGGIPTFSVYPNQNKVAMYSNTGAETITFDTQSGIVSSLTLRAPNISGTTITTTNFTTSFINNLVPAGQRYFTADYTGTPITFSTLTPTPPTISAASLGGDYNISNTFDEDSARNVNVIQSYASSGVTVNGIGVSDTSSGVWMITANFALTLTSGTKFDLGFKFYNNGSVVYSTGNFIQHNVGTILCQTFTYTFSGTLTNAHISIQPVDILEYTIKDVNVSFIRVR